MIKTHSFNSGAQNSTILGRKVGIAVLIVALFMGCKDGPKATGASPDTANENNSTEMAEAHPGKRLLESECYICHNPEASVRNMIAPPMAAVKMYYMDSTSSKKEFVEAFIAWVNDPEQESKIPWAMERFGSMPYVPYDDRTVTQIAEYVYEHDIERPRWFQPKNKTMGDLEKIMGSGEYGVEKEYAQIGLEYAKAAQSHLGKNLVKALQEGGSVGAIKFCNIQAVKIMDSISVMKNAVVQRVSDRPRNPKNRATPEEAGYISYYRKLGDSGIPPEPVVKLNQNEVNVYYPITTNAMCLQCHGRPEEEVTPETLAILTELYPRDQALGYGVNGIRGLWSINFEVNSME